MSENISLSNIHNQEYSKRRAIFTPRVKNKRRKTGGKTVLEVRHFHQKTNLHLMSFREHRFLPTTAGSQPAGSQYTWI